MQYLTKLQVRNGLRHKVRNYIEHVMNQEVGKCYNQDFLHVLSAPLQTEVVSTSLTPILRTLPAFAQCPNEFVRHLSAF